MHIICEHDKSLDYSFLKAKFKKHFFMFQDKKWISLKVLSQLHNELLTLDLF